MWFFHKLLGRVLLQMALLMVAFSLVQIARRVLALARDTGSRGRGPRA